MFYFFVANDPNMGSRCANVVKLLSAHINCCKNEKAIKRQLPFKI